MLLYGYFWKHYLNEMKLFILICIIFVYRPSCPLNPKDIQSAGAVSINNIGSKFILPNMTLNGRDEFDMTGYSVDYGFPYDNSSLILAISVPEAMVYGEILTIPVKLRRAGTVILFNVTKSGLVQVAHFDGDRNLAMFGSFIKVKTKKGKINFFVSQRTD